MELLRSRGVTLAFVARQARVPYHRVQRAMSGSGITWLEPEEQGRVMSTLARLGLLVEATSPQSTPGGY
jgi:hypothetical protein